MNRKYLSHYGILGMKWGRRKIKMEPVTPKSIGEKTSVVRRKERGREIALKMAAGALGAAVLVGGVAYLKSKGKPRLTILASPAEKQEHNWELARKITQKMWESPESDKTVDYLDYINNRWV